MKQSYERNAASISLILVIVFFVLLSLLHILEPEYNTSGQLISLYELGKFGMLMRLAFFCIGGSAFFLALALWNDLQNRRGHVGGVWLAIIGIAFIGAGIYVSDKGVGLASSVPLSLSGTLHTIFGLFVIFTAPIAFTIVGSSLGRNHKWAAMANRLWWLGALTWIGLALFFGSLVIYGASQQSVTATIVSITNRFLVLMYCLWILFIGWQKRKEEATTAS